MGSLSDAKVRSLKAKDKQYKVSDGEGLYIYILSSGKKSWRVKYFYDGKEKLYTIGLYPSIPLAEARKRLLEIKETLSRGIDPSEEKKAVKASLQAERDNLFEVVASAWIANTKAEKTEKHRQDIRSKLERFVYPDLAGRDIASITAKDFLDTVRKVEQKGLLETAKKTLGICSQVCVYAVAEGKASVNACAGLSSQLRGKDVKHFAFIVDKKLLGKLLNDIDAYPHGRLVGIALQLLPLVFTRPTELVGAKWEEISFDDAVWNIPKERMKLNRPHIVPLSKQALALLKTLYRMTGDTPYLFANWNNRNKPITSDGMRLGLRRLGYGADVVTSHGFRHTASTLLNELGFRADFIEMQLAHAVGGVRGIYNHAQFLQQRREMMQSWADFLDRLKEAQPCK